MTRITAGFASGLVVVGLVAALLATPPIVVATRGLAVGAALAVASWFLPALVTAPMVRSAASRGAPSGSQVMARTIAFVGIGVAQTPALLALVLTVGGHDVGAVLLAVPVAIASLFVNASGPGATRRRLETLRDEARPWPGSV